MKKQSASNTKATKPTQSSLPWKRIVSVLVICGAVAFLTFGDSAPQAAPIPRQKSDDFNLDDLDLGLSNGWGEAIHPWYNTISNATNAVRSLNKPGCVIIHKTGCDPCKTLKAEFVHNAHIQHLSKEFVMANLEVDGYLDKFSIDGAYAPRIYFLKPSGEIMADITNTSPGSLSEYKYYYHNGASVVQGMKDALAKVGITATEPPAEPESSLSDDDDQWDLDEPENKEEEKWDI
jgi:protein-disulfide reductase (glutathione)